MNMLERRDMFAVAALQGLMARDGVGAFEFSLHPADSLRVACWAYEVADAMESVRNAPDTEAISALFQAVADRSKGKTK